MNGKTVQTIFFLVLLAGVGFLTFLIFKPYVSALFLALVLMVIFNPINDFILAKIKNRKTIASIITTTLVLVIILFPVSFLGTLIYKEASGLANSFTNNGSGIGFVNDKISALENLVQPIVPGIDLTQATEDAAKNVGMWVADNIGSFFSGAASLTMNFFLMIAALFFFLKDRDDIRSVVVRWSPLDDDDDVGILGKIASAVNSVIKGSLFIAMIQGALAGVGFAIFGAPSPVLWGFVAALMSLIPSVGSAIVWVPMVIYLYVIDANIGMVIGLVAWCVIIVGLVDNFLRPIFLSRGGMNIHPFLILLSVFGGIAYFGPIGLVAGPIILSFTFALIDVFPNVVHIHTQESSIISSSTQVTQGNTLNRVQPQPMRTGVVKLK